MAESKDLLQVLWSGQMFFVGKWMRMNTKLTY